MLIYYDTAETPIGRTAYLLHNYLNGSQGPAYYGGGLKYCRLGAKKIVQKQ
jgi:hypothetical protein